MFFSLHLYYIIFVKVCQEVFESFLKYFFISIYSLYLFTSILYNTMRIKVYGFLSYFYGFFGTAADQLLAKIWLKSWSTTGSACSRGKSHDSREAMGQSIRKEEYDYFSLHLYYISFSFVCQVILHKLYITCDWIFFWDFAKLVIWIFQPLTTIFSEIVKKYATLCLHII